MRRSKNLLHIDTPDQQMYQAMDRRTDALKQKTRSLDLSRVRRHLQVRTTDRQTLFTLPSFFSTIKRLKNHNKKPLREL